MSTTAIAEVFDLKPVVVTGTNVHESQQIRSKVDGAYNSSRSASEVDGSVIQNVNPVNKYDALRYNATGLINQPGTGDRFGGGTKIRTFGDWGASQSIDGLPGIKFQGTDGGGYGNTSIPTIAVDKMTVQKGGRAVQYGNGSDGGVLETRIKSGRDYKNHQAISLDASSAREGLMQGEIADSTEQWDYYAAASGFYGDYNGDPENLEQQSVIGGLAKVGWNFSPDTRAEFLASVDRNQPDIIRNGEVNEITGETMIGAATLDHRLNDSQSLQFGLLATSSEMQWPARSRDRSVDNQIGFMNHFMTAPVADGIVWDGSVGAEVARIHTERDGLWDNSFVDYALKTTNAVTFNDNLQITGGLRHTWFTNDIVYNGAEQPDNLENDGLFSYQFGASYSVLEKTRVRASYATGFNRYVGKYGNFGTDALNPSGAGDEIVESRTVEVGLNQGWDGGYVDFALYNIVQENVPRRNNGAIESVEVDQSGFEAEIFATITDRLTASAGYMRVIDMEATRADGTEVNNNIFWSGQTTSVPENQFSLRLDYRVTDEIGLWTAAYHSTGYEAVDADGEVTKRDGFTRLDLGASWWATANWALRARVENVLDERDFGTAVQGTTVNDEGKLGRVFWLGTDIIF
ncbi:TonB-dependent receptor domain-containing protein [Thalassobaculum salexigens]|uniref:TonB-dependent receptor domain-containing protein n=1 Tax=Thalassobaculum salexigens TaxID=455360 RepID=UPI00248EE991|nr:TonB-dependent receptor [Thalassobaculum salexigens]